LTSSKSLISTYFRQRFPGVLHINMDMNEEPLPVLTAAVSGNMIAVVIANSSLKVFDFAQEGEEVFHAAIDPIPLDHNLGYCLSISRNQTMVALGRIGCDVWRLADSTRRLPMPTTQDAEVHITCLAFSDDGEYIVAGFDDGALCEWVLDSGMEGRRFAWPNDVDGLKSEDVITVVYAQTDDCIISGSKMSSGPPRLFIWNRRGDCTFSYSLPHPTRISISFAHWLISTHRVGDNTGRWQLRDLLTGEMKFECYPKPQEYTGRSHAHAWHRFVSLFAPILAISSDGKLAALGLSWSLSVFIWDVHENSQLAELVGHSDFLSGVGFLESHGDSKYRLVSTSLDGTIRLWDLDPLFKLKED
jgi:WD40 repeat protein